MPTRVLYHCPCSTDFTASFGPVQPSASSHALPSLYFCEDCDSIRCDLCTTKDLTAFYCPNCLFDVPLASIKSERAKCPRNCFTCPACTSTLAVVASDPRDSAASSRWHALSPEASTGEPPWYLSCPTCRWDSKEVGLTFEKPTGLSLQVQRHEDNAADSVEFNRLRHHFDVHLRASSDTPSSLAAARSSKLLRDVPSLANDPLFAPNRSKAAGRRKVEEDEKIPVYAASMTWDAGRDAKRYLGVEQGWEDGKALGTIGRKEHSRQEFLETQVDDRLVSSLEQRWSAMGDQSARAADLGPCRMPLRTKQTKRCSVCRHIIVRPDSKPTSSRFKIRLLALNHLPELHVRPPNTTTPVGSGRNTLSTLSRRKVVATDVENLHPGRTYLFEISFLNPLDDPMVVRLHIARPPSTSGAPAPDSKASTPTKTSMPPSNKFHWTVTPTTSSFPINAFNAVWELDDEESDLLELNARTRDFDLGSGGGAGHDSDETQDDRDGDDSDDNIEREDDRDHKRSRTDVGGKREGRKKGHGILRKKGHETVVGLELALSRDATGEVEFPMQVTFSYQPDAGAAPPTRGGAATKPASSKSFSFWTFIRLGRINSEHGTGQSASVGFSPTSDAISTEARRTALDKRRSVMGLSAGASKTAATPYVVASGLSSGTYPTSPMSSLKEAAAVAAADGSPRRGSSQDSSSPTPAYRTMLGQVEEQNEGGKPAYVPRPNIPKAGVSGSLENGL